MLHLWPALQRLALGRLLHLRLPVASLAAQLHCIGGAIKATILPTFV